MNRLPERRSVLDLRFRDWVEAVPQRQWMGAQQRQAALEFMTRGLPHSKEESWRFTPLQPMSSLDFGPARRAPDWVALSHRADAILGPCVGVRVLISGCGIQTVVGPQSAPIEVSLASELSGDAAALLGCVEFRGGARDSFALLNEALASDAILIRIGAASGLVSNVELVVADEEGSFRTTSFPRFGLQLADGAQARLTELQLPLQRGLGALQVGLAAIRLGAGAVLDHWRITEGSSVNHFVAKTDVDLSRDAQYRSRAVTLGGGLSRHTHHVHLAGAGASCELSGLYLVEGEEVVDHHTQIAHEVGDCTSHQLFKGVIAGHARAVFDGTVVVQRDAQRTAARQENRNLVLSDDAIVHTKPHLEIDADDVVCSHGATIGQLRDDEVFYLRARGIDEATARAMLTYSFAKEMLEVFPAGGLKDHLHRVIRDRLPGADRLEGIA